MAAGTNEVQTVTEGMYTATARSTGLLSGLSAMRAPRYFAVGFALVSALVASPALANTGTGQPRERSEQHERRSTTSASRTTSRTTAQRNRAKPKGRYRSAVGFRGLSARAAAWLTASDEERSTDARLEAGMNAAMNEVGSRSAAMSNDMVATLETEAREGNSRSTMLGQVRYSNVVSRVRRLGVRAMRSQGGVGSCWLHAYLNNRETAHYSVTGEAVNLSESYLQRGAMELQFGAAIDIAAGLDPNIPQGVSPVSAGGWHHMGPHLERTIGLVPEDAFQHAGDTFNPDAADSINNDLVANFAHEIAQRPGMSVEERQERAAAVKAEMHRNLDRYIGHAKLGPNGKIRVRQRNRRTGREETLELTPLEYAQGHVTQDDPKLVVGNFPASAMNKWHFLDGQPGFGSGLMFNTNMAVLKSTYEGTIDRDRGVWVGYEAGDQNQFGMPTRTNRDGRGAMPGTTPARVTGSDSRFRRVAGWMSTKVFHYQRLGSAVVLTKATAEITGRHGLNHAVSGVAYNRSPITGLTNRYGQQNSWGDEAMDEGFMHFRSDADEGDFMEHFVAMLGVHPEAFQPEVLRTMLGELNTLQRSEEHSPDRLKVIGEARDVIKAAIKAQERSRS